MVTGALGATGRGRPDAQRTQNAGFRDARTTRTAPSAAGTRVWESTARHLISEQVKLFFECGACKIAVYAFAHLKRVLRASFLSAFWSHQPRARRVTSQLAALRRYRLH